MSALPESSADARRLFFALWPDAELRAALLRGTAGAFVAGTPVHPDDLHVTLEFLGNVGSPRLAALEAIAAALRLPPTAELLLDRLEWWRDPALIVATARAASAPLAALQAELRSALAAAGFRVDARGFVPHLTLARRVRSRPTLADAVALRWPIRAIALVESAPRVDGPRYRPLASWTR